MLANRKCYLLFNAVTFATHTVRRTARYYMLSRKFSEIYGLGKILFDFHRRYCLVAFLCKTVQKHLHVAHRNNRYGFIVKLLFRQKRIEFSADFLRSQVVTYRKIGFYVRLPFLAVQLTFCVVYQKKRRILTVTKYAAFLFAL